ncbi:MAG: glucose-6-phosphate isomerase [Bacteroidales bacterium]|nr:glucose-6-phosphate isomerase [Bacteroidales bacterium]MDD3989783.1 glucose-6-phosphate isomerase [Bacteroidales bacterium]
MDRILDLDLRAITPFLGESELTSWIGKALTAFDTLTSRKGKGSDFLGWLDLPSAMQTGVINRTESIVKRWSTGIEVIVVVGIGGSYLGAKAVIDALSGSFDLHLAGFAKPVIVYAGNNLSEDYLQELTELLQERSVACVVISKSGTTTEPAVAFRIIKNLMEKRYGKQEASERIVAITDKSQGSLKELSDREGYTSFIIPDDVGGRFSVFSPSGILPAALAGVDIHSLLEGAASMEKICSARSKENPAIIYAALRNALYSKGKKIEILVNYNPKLQYFAEWWKQLFGESEGKDGKGIFPASLNFTTDLHSMGQYIQGGERTIFETVISVKNPSGKITVPQDPQNFDRLNFLAGKRLDECNKMAELGTLIAHMEGGVPTIRIEIPLLNSFYLGALMYMFEFSCGLSAYMLGVNPFDQPGVEDYKKNMFALLGKPGYEELAEKLKNLLK